MAKGGAVIANSAMETASVTCVHFLRSLDGTETSNSAAGVLLYRAWPPYLTRCFLFLQKEDRINRQDDGAITRRDHDQHKDSHPG